MYKFVKRLQSADDIKVGRRITSFVMTSNLVQCLYVKNVLYVEVTDGQMVRAGVSVT